MKRKVNFRGREYIVEILKNDRISIDGEIFTPIVSQQIDSLYKVKVNGNPFTIEIQGEKLLINGEDTEIEAKPFVKSVISDRESASQKEVKVKAPIPGKIANILAEEGETVQKDQELLILEAMKMRNRIFSPINGKIIRIYVQKEDSVEQDQVLLEISSE